MTRSIAMHRSQQSRSLATAHFDAGVPIFVSPVTTLAICVMVFAVLHTVATASAERVAIDGWLAVNASLYVAAAWLAKSALRVRTTPRGFELARYANDFSIAGLLMTILGICGVMLVVAISA